MNDQPAPPRLTKWSGCLLIAILAVGVFLRIYPSASFKGIGFDEHMYATYAAAGAKFGLTNYDRVVADYLQSQEKRAEAIVPATRIGFVWPAVVVTHLIGGNALHAVRIVSAAAAILLLLVTAMIGWRFGSPAQMLIVTALMALAPLQICLSQRALGDDYFAFWAVLSAWFFYESLQNRGSRGWPIAFAVSFFLLVLTKENAAFVCVALFGTWLCLCLARVVPWNFGLVVAAAIAGGAAVIILAAYLGGIGNWISFYRMYSAKSAAIPYVIRFQDGAWYRYLIDFTVVSPVIIALVFGRVFKLGKESPIDLFWALFLGFSFIVMSSIPYGMSLRFAAFWDEPLRWLAASQVVNLANRFAARWRNAALVAVVLVLLAVDLSQYYRFFVRADIYDPVSMHLLRASRLVK